MYYDKFKEDTYIIRLTRRELVNESIRKFCEKHKISNASFSAIGSIEDPVVAHYLVSTKKYTEKTLSDVYEVTSMQGNVALFNGKPLVHAHIALSDNHMRGFGGHFVEATVSATLEIILQSFPSSFEKKIDDETGLKLWQLSKKI